nr:MAG TPA: repressor domain protein [Caudoviricetes sp.]
MIYRVENKMTLFTNAEFGNVRVLEIDGEPYFVGKDVAVALGYKDSSDAIKKHVDNEDKLSRRFADSGQNREMYIINESGLYSLILSSKLPKAKEFKRWITAEVLPVIRKTGGYVNDTKQFVDYYFADCNTYGREAITLMLNETKRMANQLKAQAPKVLFAEAVESSKTSIPVGDLAKLIKQNGVDIGQNRLFSWLRMNDYLIKSGDRKNMPTQKSMDLGLFEVKISTFYRPDGTVDITKTPKVTGKGQTYLINKFLSSARGVESA